MVFELPKLNYEYDALEPYIDRKTMEIHHTKHHQGYVNKLNKAIEGSEWENKSIKELMVNLNQIDEKIKTAVRNNGGGHFNHSLFWRCLTPNFKEPSDDFLNVLKKKWNDFEEFKEEFNKKALSLFGSGWTWLVLNENKELEIIQTANQDCPLSFEKIPLLGLDVWEHAYYLNYQNRRNEYANNFWNIVNWEEVEKNYKENI